MTFAEIERDVVHNFTEQKVEVANGDPLPPIILNDTNYTNKSLERELNGEYESSQMSENILISRFYSRFRMFWPN